MRRPRCTRAARRHPGSGSAPCPAETVGAQASENVARETLAARQGHEAAQRDEGVAPPVGEPGIACDDRPAVAAPHDIGIRCALQGRAEPGAAFRLGGEDGARDSPPRCAPVAASSEARSTSTASRSASSQLSTPGDARSSTKSRPRSRSSVIAEIAIPDRLMLVAAVAEQRDRRHPLVGPPGDLLAADLGREVEGRVLVVQGVVVAAGKQRAHAQPGAAMRRQAPAQGDLGVAVVGDDLLRELGAVLGPKGPARPGIGAKGDDPPMRRPGRSRPACSAACSARSGRQRSRARPRGR